MEGQREHAQEQRESAKSHDEHAFDRHETTREHERWVKSNVPRGELLVEFLEKKKHMKSNIELTVQTKRISRFNRSRPDF